MFMFQGVQNTSIRGWVWGKGVRHASHLLKSNFYIMLYTEIFICLMFDFFNILFDSQTINRRAFLRHYFLSVMCILREK